MILLHTSGLLSALFAEKRLRAACAAAVLDARPPLVLSLFVLAELDSLVAELAGGRAALELLAEVARGAYHLAEFAVEDVDEARAVLERHPHPGIGLADASLVVLSRRLNCLDVLTLDERHFRVLRGSKGRPFHILPADH